MAKAKKKHSKQHKGGIMGHSNIPYVQRIQMQHRSDVAFNREQAAKVTMFCMSVAMYEVKGIAYKRLVRFHNRFMEYDREFYQDPILGMAHAKSRMDQMNMPISGEFFTEKVEGLTVRKQDIHDNALQAIQVALTIGAISMYDEFGYAAEVQFRISERVTELTERYKNEGIQFLLDYMEKIGFDVVNGTVRAYMDEDGNPVTPKRARKEGFPCDADW